MKFILFLSESRKTREYLTQEINPFLISVKTIYSDDLTVVICDSIVYCNTIIFYPDLSSFSPLTPPNMLHFDTLGSRKMPLIGYITLPTEPSLSKPDAALIAQCYHRKSIPTISPFYLIGKVLAPIIPH